MATGTQVPWTTPGGTPCCCEEGCPTNEDGPDATYSPGTFQSIAPSDYASLLAGGTFFLDVAVSLEGRGFPLLDIVETATASHSGIALVSKPEIAASRPCYNQLAPESALSVEYITTILGDVRPATYQNMEVEATYALATIEGETKISFANAKSPQGTGSSERLIKIFGTSGADLPSAVLVTVTNPSYSEPPPPGIVTYETASSVTTNVTFVLPSATYSPSSLIRVIYFYDPIALDIAEFSGSISMNVTFSPSAP